MGNKIKILIHTSKFKTLAESCVRVIIGAAMKIFLRFGCKLIFSVYLKSVQLFTRASLNQ